MYQISVRMISVTPLRHMNVSLVSSYYRKRKRLSTVITWRTLTADHQNIDDLTNIGLLHNVIMKQNTCRKSRIYLG